MKGQRGIFEKPTNSGIWWVSYFDQAGKRRREKAGTRGMAVTLYNKRKREVLVGTKIPELIRSVIRVEDLAPALLRDYRIHGQDVDTAERRLRLHLLPSLGRIPANELGTDAINAYVDARIHEGAENATINREMAALKRVYNLALESDPPKVNRCPSFPHLKENPPRQGFVDDSKYRALVNYADELWLRTILAVGYTFGFRKGELLLELKVGQVDLGDRTIRLHVGTTKNDEGREVSMTDEVFELVRRCIEGKGPHDFVFTRTNREPVRNFRGAWYALCEKAGLGEFVKGADGKSHWQGLLFHDLRRSAVRNMVRAGIPEKTAMRISGHKTRSVFDRYDIVNSADLVDAARKMERRRALEAKKSEIASGTRSGTRAKSDQGAKRRKSTNSIYLQ